MDSKGGANIKLFSTSEGGLYAMTATGLYRLTKGGDAWSLINTNLPIEEFSPITEHGGVLYLASHKIFASADRGETWNELGDFFTKRLSYRISYHKWGARTRLTSTYCNVSRAS